jgi:hypothetical protein
VNIFVVNENPYIAARNLCDKHVVKMIVESCQMLSTSDQLHRGLPRNQRYKIAYQHHPCVRSLQNQSNYIWLTHHLRGLLQEYTARYSKHHSCEKLFEDYWMKTYLMHSFDFSKTNFPKCMPDQFKTDSTIDSYRNYYRFKKETLKTFSYRIPENCPKWLDSK